MPKPVKAAPNPTPWKQRQGVWSDKAQNAEDAIAKASLSDSRPQAISNRPLDAAKGAETSIKLPRGSSETSTTSKTTSQAKASSYSSVYSMSL